MLLSGVLHAEKLGMKESYSHPPRLPMGHTILTHLFVLLNILSSDSSFCYFPPFWYLISFWTVLSLFIYVVITNSLPFFSKYWVIPSSALFFLQKTQIFSFSSNCSNPKRASYPRTANILFKKKKKL